MTTSHAPAHRWGSAVPVGAAASPPRSTADRAPSSAAHTAAGASRPLAERSIAPDLARGVMLLLIAAANVPWMLWGQPRTPDGVSAAARGPWDAALQALCAVAVDQRIHPLFAFLLGCGMVQLYRSRRDRGADQRAVRAQMRRRHGALVVIGVLHALLLFHGDILGAYGLTGLVLVWMLFGRRERTLIRWCVLLGGGLLIGGLGLLVTGLVLWSRPEVAQAAPVDPTGGVLVVAGATSGVLPAAALRMLIWAANLPATVVSAVPVCILLGWIAGRRRLLDEPWRHRRALRCMALIGIPLGWAAGVPDALVTLGVLRVPQPIDWVFAGTDIAFGAVTGLGYAGLLGLLALRLEGRGCLPVAPWAASDPRRGSGPLDPLDPSYGVPAGTCAPPRTRGLTRLEQAVVALGRRSLTFYLLQSVLLVPLLAGWALGLGQVLSTAQALALAAGVWAVSLLLATWMESRGMRGPAERLLRRMACGPKHPRRVRGG